MSPDHPAYRSSYLHAMDWMEDYALPGSNIQVIWGVKASALSYMKLAQNNVYPHANTPETLAFLQGEIDACTEVMRRRADLDATEAA